MRADWRGAQARPRLTGGYLKVGSDAQQLVQRAGLKLLTEV
jgi:hypothetical protein